MDPLAELAIAVTAEGADPERLKRTFCEDHGLERLPSNAEIIAHAPPHLRDHTARVLRRKPTRTLSGVAPVAVMTSPAPCPHGTCVFCPGGVERGTPQSYTGREPAAMRGAQHRYDPASQVAARLRQYQAVGHRTDKIDLIVMGGTFTSRDPAYQEGFVRACLDALNGAPSPDLRTAQRNNESGPHRCIGLTVETRPDQFTDAQVAQAVSLGTTRVEIGVQTVFDDILEIAGRQHTVADSVAATARAKAAGLKVLYHMMPGLPGTTPERDLEALERIVTDSRFMPDMLKIYPTLVIEGTELHRMWLAGDYEPLDDGAAIALLARAKALVPPWVRIQRIQRDIPAPLILAGPRRGNLRELVREEMFRRGTRCRCIRCREVGRYAPDRGGVTSSASAGPWPGGRSGAPTPPQHDAGVPDGGDPAPLSLRRREYEASGGREIFLSFEDDGEAIAGYLRLRIADNDSTPGPAEGGMALVRELKVLGEALALGERGRGWQHRGMGARLMEEAEFIAASEGFAGVRVTSGVGVWGYYRRRGYRLEGMYMVKRL